MISEVQTARDLWPAIWPWIVWVYGEVPIWGNSILMLFGIGLMYTSYRTSPRTDSSEIRAKDNLAALSVQKPTPAPIAIGPRKEWRPLTATEIVEFIEFARPRSEYAYALEAVKFIANDSGRVIADRIARTLVALGYEVVINHDDANYIFPAKSELLGLTIRYPAGESMKMCFRLGASLNRANLRASQVEFPKSDQFNFVQVEIGDWKDSCQWQWPVLGK